MVKHDFNRGILEEVAHRPWRMPDRPWVMTQTWHDLLFAHWRVDPSQLRSRVPAAFALDLFDGDAWIGIVPFHMTNVAPRGVPSLPWLSEFPELNVRTYVRVGDRPGIYFFSLDAASAAAVLAARTLLNLPYHSASMIVSRTAERVEYQSCRDSDRTAVFSGTYRPTGDVFTAAEGSLEYFLTERYCLYHMDHQGAPYRLDIHHPPWPLQPAEAHLVRNTMPDVNGLTVPAQPPLFHFSKRQDMVAWAPQGLP
ncbi:MAG: DUF2071 domain-containing protein [Acidobacteria bacterium]|nr:DUF2071 domain-containing protein [Acidobacteriota bacterium]